MMLRWAASTLMLSCVDCSQSSPLPERATAMGKIELSELWSMAPEVLLARSGDGSRLAGPRPIVQPDGTTVRVYPCEATLTVRAIIKGSHKPLPQKVLWFSYWPQCSFEHWPQKERRSEEQVWFLKVEGHWLRPIYDNTLEFVGLSQPLIYGDNSELRFAFARAVLTPGHVVGSEEEFVHRLTEFRSLAREIVGNAKSKELLGETQRHASASLKAEICRDLAGDDECSFSDCPSGILYPGSLRELEEMQKSRKVGHISEISEKSVARLLGSGNAQDRQRFLESLISLSCNHDSFVKSRVRRLLDQNFPGTALPSCLTCR